VAFLEEVLDKQVILYLWVKVRGAEATTSIGMDHFQNQSGSLPSNVHINR
jgi:hypothetical protein